MSQVLVPDFRALSRPARAVKARAKLPLDSEARIYVTTSTALQTFWSVYRLGVALYVAVRVHTSKIMGLGLGLATWECGTVGIGFGGRVVTNCLVAKLNQLCGDQ